MYNIIEACKILPTVLRSCIAIRSNVEIEEERLFLEEEMHV